MKKTNSCLNSLAVIKYIAKVAPDHLDELFEGIDQELAWVENKREFLSDPNNWVSSSVMLRLYENAKKILKDKKIAYRIGYSSVIERRFGYVQKILIYAFGKPSKILADAQRINDKFNKTKTIHLVNIERNRAVLRLHWHRDLPLSRDFCLFNQGIYSAIPTVWGGKSCQVTEERCYFKGDPYCEYHISWVAQNRLKDRIFQIVAPWRIANESIRELERDKEILQKKYDKIQALNKELETKIGQLSALYETSTAILSTLKLPELLDKVLNRMMTIARLDRAGVFLLDKDGNRLNLIHATGVDKATLKRLKSYHVPVDKKNNIIARAARSKKPILVEDVNSISLNRQNPLLAAFKPKAFVIVPLTVRDAVVGIMVGDNASDRNFIKEIDRDFLTSFANHIAVAIENANLYKQVETSEKKYRQIVENINEGIILMNEGGSILFSNKRMNEMAGRDDLSGINIYDMVTGEEDRKKLVGLMMLNYDGKQAKEEVMLKPFDRPDPVPVLMSSVPIAGDEDQSAQGSLALFTDLSQQKELERKLLQAQKLESIGTMAGGIAHDFNNILTGILGFTTLMKEKTRDNPELSRFTDIIERSSLRAADLVKKMLVFSRDTTPKDHAVCRPTDVMEETLSLVESSFPKNIAIEVSLPKECPSVVCSHSQLQQIIMNLCINARDAMPGGGTIDINIEPLSVNGLSFVMRKRLRGKEFLRLSVSDTGSGIPPEVLDRIFDPFFTTKEVGKGSGLGLAMVYGIIEGVGGAIDVKTRIGLGTTFDLYFPVADESAPNQGAGGESVPLRGGETVLIVDDEEMLRVLASEILKPYGYRLLTAKDGREAVSIYKSMFPNIDIVVMDVLMPEMDGFQAAREIRKFDPSVKILFCSGYTSMSEISDSDFAWGQDHLSELIKKPFNSTELALHVRKMLGADKAAGSSAPV